jgi:hypothetical protein
MKRLFVLLLAILILLIFTSITFGQQEKSKQTKKEPPVTETVNSKTPISKPDKPVQQIKPKQEGIYGPGEWDAKNNKPLYGKGTDIKLQNRQNNPAASGLPTGKRQAGNQSGVNKISPDVIDPLKNTYQDGDDHLKVDKNNINKLSPNVLDSAKQNIKSGQNPANLKMKTGEKNTDKKEISKNKPNKKY